MTRILIVDDDIMYHTILKHVLEPLHYDLFFSENGKQGITMAHEQKPDLIISDVMMPDISGFELTRALRRDPNFTAIPILILTGQSGLTDKINSFEAGADDYLSKPFETEELLARVNSLLRRAEYSKTDQQKFVPKDDARVIALQSLRGGVGCSSLAINISIGLESLWKAPVILLDLTMTAGQIALMLNMDLRRTWSDIPQFKLAELNQEIIDSIICKHETGIHFIAAPTFPSEADKFTGDMLSRTLEILNNKYDYILADLSHDFNEISIRLLDRADLILMIASPDIASIRAVSAAMDTYTKLGYPKEKCKLVLNASIPNSNITRAKIESALDLTTILSIPYLQDIFVDAINLGQPLMQYRKSMQISNLIEDFSFFISKDIHKKAKPEIPTEAWKRVYKRFQDNKRIVP
jgi:pilus assembly protein CpaE